MRKVTRVVTLTAPAAGQKPASNRSTNGALTGKKPAPYKKFKPESAEAETAAPPPASARRETPFGVWLRGFVARLAEKGQSLPAYKQNVCEYVAEGAPYRGDSLWESKDRLRELGAKFARNPEKKEGCEDKSIKRGWWAAGDDAVLFLLLNLDRNESGRSQWSCLDMGAVQQGVLKGWLRTFSEETGTPMPDDAEVTPDDEPRPARGLKRPRAAAEDDVPKWILAAMDGKHLTPWVPEPTCGACQQKVLDQFLDCGCNGAKWTRCSKCTAIYRPGAPAPHDKCKC